MSARGFYSDLGITLPGSTATGSVSVRCFANPSAHKRDDRNASCSVNLDTGQWECFACGAAGGAFDAAVAVGWSRSDEAALAKRHDLFASDRERTNPAQLRAAGSRRAARRLPTEEQVAAWHDALIGQERIVVRLGELRGWTLDAIDALELGIDGERVTFPIRDSARRLVGLLRYAPNPETRNGRKMLAVKGTPRELFPPPEALPADVTLYVTEGEPDSVAMRSLGLAAVGVPGARSWKSEWAPRFAGRDVVLIPDLDAEGRELMAQAARDLLPQAARVRVVDMDPARDDGSDAGDVVRDAAQDRPGGLARARRLVERMIAEAPALEPPPIEHTGGLLDALRGFVCRYVVLNDAQADAVALWVLHTWAIEAAQSTPYLSITSAEKECGKTRLLEAAELLVARPWFTGRTTAAALARKTDAERPTLLLDESDAAFKGEREYAETLRGVLNTGYRRGGKTTVCVGQATDMTTRDFSTFGAKAIAGIGELPDTVASRSIPIRLKRRAPGEAVERFKRKVADAQAVELRERVTAWAAQHEKVLGDADPDPLVELGDRADEVWEPLRAIADLAGEGWPARARAAAIGLSGRGEGDDAASDGVLVLLAIREAIGDRRKVATAELLEKINANDDLPFGGRRKGEGLNARGLAGLLRPYGIKSGTVRLDERTTMKGYQRADFEDAWTRYLPAEASQASHPSHDSDPPQENPHEHWDVTDVTDKPGEGGSDRHTAVTDRRNGAPSPGSPATLAADEVVARIVREFDAIELTEDCIDPLAHARQHQPHPDTSSTVCVLCHPLAALEPTAQPIGGVE